jgi:hypothetical protein
VLIPQHDPPVHKHLFHNLVFGHAKEYFKATRTLALFSLAPMSFDMTLVLTTLHLESNGSFLLFLKNYELGQDLELFFIRSNWHSNACPINRQVVLWGWFLNTFEIVFTQKI